MPFQKGQSGNPYGARVKSREQREFEEKCRQWCRDFAFDKLKKKLDSEDDKISSWALEAILNRAFGKPVETAIVENHVTQETGTSIADIERDLAEIIGSKENPDSKSNPANSVDRGT